MQEHEWRFDISQLAVTLGLAAAAWAVTVPQMGGMNMGVATQLGSFGVFAALWVPMMAAMMLPGAAPAVLRRAEAGVRAVPLFVGSYLAVWALVGVVVYGLYRPHGAGAAGVVVIAAGVYELTPLKLRCRRRCRESVSSGFAFGLFCVGSSIGLMLILAGAEPHEHRVDGRDRRARSRRRSSCPRRPPSTCRSRSRSSPSGS